MDIYTALEKCNNIVFCVDRAPSLKVPLIPRCMQSLQCSPMTLGAGRYVMEGLER